MGRKRKEEEELPGGEAPSYTPKAAAELAEYRILPVVLPVMGTCSGHVLRARV